MKARLVALIALMLCAGCHRPAPASAPARPAAAPVSPGPNIIFISIDTLRADRLGCYGNQRPASPFLDSFAAQSTRFARCISQAPTTAPSHMTMFTSLYPAHHNVRYKYEGKTKEAGFMRLNPATPILAQLLKKAGYQTAGFHAGGQISASGGFGRGFDLFSQGERELSAARMRQVKGWLDSRGRNKFFLFLHTYQMHDPYLPPPPYDRRFDPDYQGWIKAVDGDAGIGGPEYRAASTAFWQRRPDYSIDTSKFSRADVDHLLALYDGNLAYIDDLFRGFFEWAALQTWWDNTIVIITSDHGEEFLEHENFMHSKLYVETLHVPLIVRVPGGAGRVDGGLAGLIDLAPTILDLAGVAVPKSMLGHSLAARLRGEAPGDRMIFSQEPYIYREPHRAVRDGRYCLYIQGDQPPALELFDVAADPGEHHNLAAERPDEVARLKAAIDSTLPLPPKAQPGRRPAEANQMVPLTQDEKKKLRALGYMQ